MRDLSIPLGALVPSSQEGGNLVQGDLAKKTMTAAGSEPVTPLPDPHQQANPEPNATAPVQDGPLDLPVVVPVADTKARVHTAPGVPFASGRWAPTPTGSTDLSVPFPGSSWQGEMKNAQGS